MSVELPTIEDSPLKDVLEEELLRAWPSTRNLVDISQDAWAEIMRVLDDIETPATDIFDISGSTWRKRKREHRLRIAEFDTLYRFDRVLKEATRIFGSRASALQWLNSPNKALREVRPIELLRTDVGTDGVEQVLNRIAFGIYS